MTPPAPHIRRGARVLVTDFLNLQPKESVLITVDERTDTCAARAIFEAAREAGVLPVLLKIPTLPFQGALADPYVPELLHSVAASAALWIDMTFPYLAGSHVHENAIKAGVVRYALAGDLSADGLGRLFGSMDLDRYFSVHTQLENLLAGAQGKTVRICCPRGTDVSFVVAEAPYRKPRRAQKSGSFTLPGSCAFFPVLESVKGRIVFTAIFHEFYSPCADLAIQVDGVIQALEGPVEHRVALDRALRRAGNGSYGNIIHFTHGLSPSARTTGASFIEDSRVLGCNAIGMGLPWWQPGGGENHPDGMVSDQSMWVDGEQIVADGLIVHPPALAALSRELISPSH
ncbi:MAG: hypothetical protein Q7T63_13090 [Burkholderiaceae bacterium]|nr:hypothetical protein [Burkholderiaceae bacterium]